MPLQLSSVSLIYASCFGLSDKSLSIGIRHAIDVKNSKNPPAMGLYHTPNHQKILASVVSPQKLIAKLLSTPAAKDKVSSPQHLSHIFLIISVAIGGIGEIELLVCWPHSHNLRSGGIAGKPSLFLRR